MVGEGVVWLLFFALLVPAGFVGWVIGHSTAKMVTRTVALSPSTSPSAPTATSTATSSPTRGAAEGKAVFVASGCGSCHTLKAAGTTGTIGPNLDAKPAVDAKKAHMSLAAFVRESIVRPNAYISPGYPKGVMPQNFATRLSKMQLMALVALITGK